MTSQAHLKIKLTQMSNTPYNKVNINMRENIIICVTLSKVSLNCQEKKITYRIVSN